MALTDIGRLQANSNELLPHIEEAAFKFITREYAMLRNVKVLTDMTGMNVRKISAYLPTRRAVDLSEDTDIPDTRLERARLSEVTPIEVGDRYRVSNRRWMTDLENVLVDTTQALGRAVGERIEQDLMDRGVNHFIGGQFGTLTTNWSLGLLASTRMAARQRYPNAGMLTQVTHPYQLLPVIEDLLKITGSESGAAAFGNLQNATSAAESIISPLWDNLVVAPMTPRRVIYQINVYGTGGTFRLQIGDDYQVGAGKNVSAEITVNATQATMITNIQTAIRALTANNGWTVTAPSGVTGITNLTITPPTSHFVDDFRQLRVAVDVSDADDVTYISPNFDIIPRKGKYDLVTTISASAPQDGADVALGVTIKERSATAKGLSYFRDALVFDQRSPLNVGSELVKQQRTIEFYISMFYGEAIWHPEYGFHVLSKANSPTAVG